MRTHYFFIGGTIFLLCAIALLWFFTPIQSFVLRQLAAAGLGCRTNPTWDIQPYCMFPNWQSVVPQGATYTDTVPDTLDLAERAAWFIQGAIFTHMPHPLMPTVWVPAGPINLAFNRFAPDRCEGQPPCMEPYLGTPNWGKGATAQFRALEMSPYAHGNALNLMTGHLNSVHTMLDYNIMGLMHHISPSPPYGIGIAVQGGCCSTTYPVAMDSLIAAYEAHPDNAELKHGIDVYADMHSHYIKPFNISGRVYWSLTNGLDPSDPADGVDSMLGYLGYYAVYSFINGRAGVAMWDWYNRTGNETAHTAGIRLNDFLYNFRPLWDNPDPGRFPNEGAGQYIGCTHCYLQAPLSWMGEVKARFKVNPSDPIAQKYLTSSQQIYDFTKRHANGGEILGNFGEAGMLGDMLRLAMLLGPHNGGVSFEDAERWVRNAAAEMQIDPQLGEQIPNHSSSNYGYDQVGRKAAGMYLTDATHSLAIPEFMFETRVDPSGNLFRGVYEVWKDGVNVDGNTAWVNILMNRADKYLDVRSDIPYQGQVEVQTKTAIGPITKLMVRIPSWANKNQVQVRMRDVGGSDSIITPSWSGNYVSIANIQVNKVYTVAFPIVIQTSRFTDLRSMDQAGFEGNYPSPALPEMAPSPAETVINYQGKFRGDTLVDATPRPTEGVARYQRQHLANLPNGDVPAPRKTVQRFVIGGTNGPTPPPTPPPPAPPTLSYTGASIGVSPGNDWRLAGAGDFNADGKDDLLWQKKSDATPAFWYLSGTLHFSAATLVNPGSSAWQIVGAGDLDGNGKKEILWQHSSDSRGVAWFMNGTTLTSSPVVAQSNQARGWRLAGAGDFNADGKDDLLWQNNTDESVGVWFMNGASLISTANISNSSNAAGWRLAGSGDFNADGKDDLLWQNNSDGRAAVWILPSAGTPPPPPPPPPPAAPSCSISAPSLAAVGTPTSVSWASENASSSTLRLVREGIVIRDESVPVSGATSETYTTAGAHRYTLSLLGAGGSGSCSASVNVQTTLPQPPTVPLVSSRCEGGCGYAQFAPPSGFTATCNAEGTRATLRWDGPAGTIAWLVRVNDTSNPWDYGWNGSRCTGDLREGDVCTGSVAGLPPYTIATVPGRGYAVWVHTVTSEGYGDQAGINFSCAVQTASSPFSNLASALSAWATSVKTFFGFGE